MSTATAHSPSELVREAILDAAQARLLRFGYHKTTMSEIADDAGMSAANLYRYFRNKQDIVADHIVPEIAGRAAFELFCSTPSPSCSVTPAL